MHPVFLEPVRECPAAHSKKTGSSCLVAAKLLQRLEDQLSLNRLDVQARIRQAHRQHLTAWSPLLQELGKHVERDFGVTAEKNDSFDCIL
jgi:hypothetical protein